MLLCKEHSCSNLLLESWTNLLIYVQLGKPGQKPSSIDLQGDR